MPRLPSKVSQEKTQLTEKPDDGGSACSDPTPNLSFPADSYYHSNLNYNDNRMHNGGMDGENGECYGEMDGETGEWFPPASSSSVKVKEKSELEQNPAENSGSDDSSSDDDEFSDRAVKRVAKEILDNCMDEDGIPRSSNHTIDPIESKPKVPLCSYLFAFDESPSEAEDDKPSHSEHLNNGYKLARCNEEANHRKISNGYPNRTLKT